MAYFYRIYFNDGQTKNFTDKEVVGKNLPDLDKFSLTQTFQVDLERGCQDVMLLSSNIARITIVHKKDKGNPTEYSILGKNPYFYDVYDHLSEQEVWGYNHNYKVNKDIISNESEAYRDMRTYLLEQLKRNSRAFFTEIYKYDDKFKEVLVKYANSYSDNVTEEEEYRNIIELEKAVSYYLSFYKNFRKLAVRRYKYEKYGNYPKQTYRPEAIKFTKEELEARQRILNQFYAEADSISKKLNEFNEKYDEFIEPDEYDQMTGGFEGKVR